MTPFHASDRPPPAGHGTAPTWPKRASSSRRRPPLRPDRTSRAFRRRSRTLTTACAVSLSRRSGFKKFVRERAKARARPRRWAHFDDASGDATQCPRCDRGLHRRCLRLKHCTAKERSPAGINKTKQGERVQSASRRRADLVHRLHARARARRPLCAARPPARPLCAACSALSTEPVGSPLSRSQRAPRSRPPRRRRRRSRSPSTRASTRGCAACATTTAAMARAMAAASEAAAATRWSPKGQARHAQQYGGGE